MNIVSYWQMTYISLLVFFDVDNAVLAVSEPFSGVLSTQPLDEGVSAAADLFGKLNDVDAFQYDVVCLHRIRTGERRTSHNINQSINQRFFSCQ